MNKIELLQKMIDESENIVFFGGAGVSTASGIPDFRSQDGLYSQKFKYPPEYMLSIDLFEINPSDFFDFYKDKMNCLSAKPNSIHNFLKQLEDKGKLKAIVTQNIDGLHQKAGNQKVYELHGSIYRNHCARCNKSFAPEAVFNCKGVPKCDCGGIIKPDVVLYGEALPQDEFNGAIRAIRKADMMIVAGTSLTVQPAAGLVSLFEGKHLVIINRDTTYYDEEAELVINENMKDVFDALKI